jgi:hypothetical protein
MFERERNTVPYSKSMRCMATVRQIDECRKRKREEAEHFIEKRCDKIVFY